MRSRSSVRVMGACGSAWKSLAARSSRSRRSVARSQLQVPSCAASRAWRRRSAVWRWRVRAASTWEISRVRLFGEANVVDGDGGLRGDGGDEIFAGRREDAGVGMAVEQTAEDVAGAAAHGNGEIAAHGRMVGRHAGEGRVIGRSGDRA